jgi:hypothetical protein
MEFEMGWSSLTNTTQSSGPFVKNVSKGARFMWATEAELYFPPNNSSKDPSYEFLPRSPYNIWDLVVKDQDGKALEPAWECSSVKPGITLDCGWTGDHGEKGISMRFASDPMPSRLKESDDVPKVSSSFPLQ